MSMDDWDIYKDFKAFRQQKRNARLQSANSTGWSKHTEYHWYRHVDGHKLDYWPSSNKYQYRGKMYRGAMPRNVKQLIEKEGKQIG